MLIVEYFVYKRFVCRPAGKHHMDADADDVRARYRRQDSTRTRCGVALVADYRVFQEIGRYSVSRTVNYLVCSHIFYFSTCQLFINFATKIFAGIFVISVVNGLQFCNDMLMVCVLLQAGVLQEVNIIFGNTEFSGGIVHQLAIQQVSNNNR